MPARVQGAPAGFASPDGRWRDLTPVLLEGTSGAIQIFYADAVP